MCVTCSNHLGHGSTNETTKVNKWGNMFSYFSFFLFFVCLWTHFSCQQILFFFLRKTSWCAGSAMVEIMTSLLHFYCRFVWLSVARWISKQWSTLWSGSQIVACNYHFCDDYFFTCSFHSHSYWSVHLGNSWSFVCGCSSEKQPKMVITVNYLAARSKHRSYWNCEVHFVTEQYK